MTALKMGPVKVEAARKGTQGKGLEEASLEIPVFIHAGQGGELIVESGPQGTEGLDASTAAPSSQR